MPEMGEKQEEMHSRSSCWVSKMLEIELLSSGEYAPESRAFLS